MCNVRSHTSNPIGCYKRDMNYTVINKQVRKEKKPLENTEGQSKMDNPEKLATLGTQDEDKQNKNTRKYVLDTTIRKQTQIK